jgi:DNA mismatch endonuclease (patch repair protein)
MPKSKLPFWREKLEQNKTRDKKNMKLLRDAGWNILVLWECQLRDRDALAARINNFLRGDS